MTFPREHGCKLHTTNSVEHLNGEIKHRTEAVGIFPNEAPIYRLMSAMLLQQTDEWLIQCRYMIPKTHANLAEDLHLGLQAVAN